MIDINDLSRKNWWDYIHTDLQELLKESLLLIDKVSYWETKFHDYSFVVFPASKAYEGFLKKLFLDMGFISEETYFAKRFRVGKALNPALLGRLKESSVHTKITNFCGGTKLADALWDTWKECRNILFHWFPEETNAISFAEAKVKVEKIINSIDLAFNECKLKNKV